MTSDKPTRQELVDFLKSHGWDEEKANRLLDGQVGVCHVQIPGPQLLDVLQELVKEGIPIGRTPISFMVPRDNWDNFKETAQRAIAKHGGFVLTPEEDAAIAAANVDGKVSH